jgi:cyanosortase A-associated protein
MGITHWKQFRIFLLGAIAIAVICSVAISIFYPGIGNRTPTPFSFPAAVELPQWEMVNSAPLQLTKEDPSLKAGRQYGYRQNGLSIDIEMRYAIDTHGNVKSFMENHAAIKSSPSRLIMRQQQGVGFYGLWLTQKRAYLSACINPRGSSTVTLDQFWQNHNTYDVHFSRILPWLLGQQKLLDRRCLWALLSTSLESASPADANKVLETAWVSWYRWWQSNFPPP